MTLPPLRSPLRPRRRRPDRPVILGLTGSLAMGKSTAARMFRKLGVRVHDADDAVHRLLAPGGAGVEAVTAVFPGARAGDRIDRAALGAIVFRDAAALAALEAVLHPLVREEERRFLRRATRERRRLAVLDIPLLFETGGDARCDRVAVVSAPAFVQRARAMARPGMTEGRFRAVLARQLPDAQKRRLADFVISTGLGYGFTFRRIKRLVRRLTRPLPR